MIDIAIRAPFLDGLSNLAQRISNLIRLLHKANQAAVIAEELLCLSDAALAARGLNRKDVIEKLSQI